MPVSSFILIRVTRFIVRQAWKTILFFAVSAAIFYTCTLYYVYDHMEGNAKFPADCGIVFGTAVWAVRNGAGEVVGATAGPGIERRVITAAHLVEEGSLRRLFLSGGKGEGNPKSEAEVMREVAREQGIPARLLMVEDRARSTWENLENTRPLTSGCSSVVAISDGYHLARIGLQAQIQGFALTTYPATPRPSMLFFLRSWLREAAGIDLLVLLQLLT